MARPRQRATLADWARSVPATTALVSTMIGFELPLRGIDRFLGQEAVVDAGHLLARMMWRCFRMTGAKLEVVGLEHVDLDERYLIVANHQGFSDVVVISNALRELQPRYVAKRELARGWPSVSFMIQASGSAIIDRKRPESAIAELERLGHEARRKRWSVAIFPEGTRAKDGVPRRWKPRGTRALLETMSPSRVLPVSLIGGAELFAHNGLPFKSGVQVRCHIHPSVAPPGPEDDFAAWLEGVRETVASVL